MDPQLLDDQLRLTRRQFFGKASAGAAISPTAAASDPSSPTSPRLSPTDR